VLRYLDTSGIGSNGMRNFIVDLNNKPTRMHEPAKLLFHFYRSVHTKTDILIYLGENGIVKMKKMKIMNGLSRLNVSSYVQVLLSMGGIIAHRIAWCSF
jgi:hypothetical protein